MLSRPPWRQILTLLLLCAVAVVVVRVTKPRDFTSNPPNGADQWAAEAGRPQPRDSSAAEVAQYFSSLSPTAASELAQEFPYVVSSLDGAPPTLRYEASAIALQQHPQYELYADLQLLSFDPRGPGHGAFVYGDLATAAHVAIIVTGNDTQLEYPEDTLKKIAWAENLRQSVPTDTAVIFWAGYTSPISMSIEAFRSGAAVNGAVRLGFFADGIDEVTDGDLSLVCHSYGTLVCAKALDEDRMPPISSLSLLGSPGVDLESASELNTDAPVFAALADSDWIGDLPQIRFAGIGHSTNPAEAEFGAQRITANDVNGHDGYLVDGASTLACVAQIVETAAANGCEA